jgi:hypothetical protein
MEFTGAATAPFVASIVAPPAGQIAVLSVELDAMACGVLAKSEV